MFGSFYATHGTIVIHAMLSLACGTELAASETDGDLFQSATRRENALPIKIVNLSEGTKPLTLLLPGVPDQTAHGRMLTGEKNAVNSFARQEKTAPLETEVTCAGFRAEMELPPWSLTVLQFSLAERE